MQAPVKIAIAAVSALALFGTAYGLGALLVPQHVVDRWQGGTGNPHGEPHGQGSDAPQAAASDHLRGVAASADGYLLTALDAPHEPGIRGELSFRIETADGAALTDVEVAHEQDLHLIVVRSDGAAFRHVHPELDAATGTWSLPWEWDAAGSYRVYADVVPTATGEAITLTSTIDVGGDFSPERPEPSTVDHVDGIDVTLTGELSAGSTSGLTVRFERDGEPVTDLQPYLGAFGHLVALREADMAYLHVHAEDAAATATAAGPEIAFAAEAPSTGRYLLYLDFRVGDEVRTARFVLDAGHGDAAQATPASEPYGTPSGEPHTDDSHSDDH